MLQFQQFALTTLPQDAIAWDGSAFIYGGENTRTLMMSDVHGQGVKPFVKLPANHGEIRCVASPAAHGFPATTVFCAIANGDIFRIGAHDPTPVLFAHLPTTEATDGALAFDSVGAFGYALVAASGGSDEQGGAIFSVNASGQATQIGTYKGPGGADNIAIAPQNFGAFAGQVLIAEDEDNTHGHLLAMGPGGAVHVLMALPPADGLNPIAVINGTHGSADGPAPGLYLSEWLGRRVLFAPASQLAAYVGDVLVGTERHAQFFLVQPAGSGVRVIPVHTNLAPARTDLEGADYIGS